MFAGNNLQPPRELHNVTSEIDFPIKQVRLCMNIPVEYMILRGKCAEVQLSGYDCAYLLCSEDMKTPLS